MSSFMLTKVRRTIMLAPLIMTIVGTIWSGHASAMSGFAENVQNQCRLAGRSVPNLGSPPCKTCHVGTAGQESKNNLNAKGIDYRSGRVLAAFCPDKPLPPSDNHPPQLTPIATPIQGTAGVTMSWGISATDADGDSLIIKAKGLPKGARLRRDGQSGGEWRATLTWTPSQKQNNRSYAVVIRVKEKGRKPALMTEQVVQLTVGNGVTNTPTTATMHPIGDPVWLEGERSGHGRAYRSRPAECRTCHGDNLRGTSSSAAASPHRYVLDDVGLIEIRAGTKVGCWTCHNGPSGEDDDRDDRDRDD